MKETIKAAILLGLVAFQGGVPCLGVEYPMVSMKVRAIDEHEKPIMGVSVSASDHTLTQKAEGRRDTGITDHDGFCHLKFRALAGASVYAKKENSHYPSVVSSRTLGKDSPFRFQPFIYRNDIPQSDQIDPPLKKEISLEGSVTLREIRKPIPLYAQKLRIDFPARDVWLGYDLASGDWIAPYGKGKSGDIMFRSAPKAEIAGMALEETPGIAILEVAFGEGGGLVRINDENGFLIVSRMTMPHEAPIAGYEEIPTLKIEQQGYEYQEPTRTRAYFFRTRVVREGERIIRANFGKIPMNIKYHPVQKPEAWFGDKKANRPSFGGVEFTYYFNPTPNDRNLEFDPKKNLFKVEDEQWIEYTVEDP